MGLELSIKSIYQLIKQLAGAMMMMGYLSLRAPRQLAGGRSSSNKAAERAALLGEEDAGAGAAVPRGYFAVYVGAEARRFVVPVSYLCQPAFRALMELAAEEFGFGQAGGLRFPCREEDFLAIVADLDAARADRAESRNRRRSSGAGAGAGKLGAMLFAHARAQVVQT